MSRRKRVTAAVRFLALLLAVLSTLVPSPSVGENGGSGCPGQNCPSDTTGGGDPVVVEDPVANPWSSLWEFFTLLF